MSELLETLAGLIKQNGIPKKQLWWLLVFFLFIMAVTWYLNLCENNTSELITSTGIASFYAFAVLVLLWALWFAQQQVEEWVNFPLAWLVRDEFRKRNIRFNKLWDTTNDVGNQFVGKNDIENTYWAYKRGSDDGILFTLARKGIYTVYAWIGETVYKLGDSENEKGLLERINTFDFQSPNASYRDRNMNELLSK